MNFVRFDSLDSADDGDRFLVVYPNGSVVFCWYSRRGHFAPVVNFEIPTEYYIEDLTAHESTLVCCVKTGE